MMQPIWENGLARLFHADARRIPLADQSVHCVVTSPPYWGLRSYGLGEWVGGDSNCEHSQRAPGTQRQTISNSSGYKENGLQPAGAICNWCGAVWDGAGIGLEPTLDEWVQNMVEVGREVWRVLRDDGIFFLNLGDSYAGGGRGPGGIGSKQLTNAGSVALPPENGSGLPAKNLMGQPWRVAFALQANGWILRQANIWFKDNPMPESTTDRPTSAYEMIFMFAKSNTPQFWTHRDGLGARTAPAPDYRYVDRVANIEYAEEPAAWSDEMIPCSECGGSGEITVEREVQLDMFAEVDTSDADPCNECNADSDPPYHVRRWQRVNLWRGHDYFYDGEAVREPHNDKAGGINRFGTLTRTIPAKPSGVRGEFIQGARSYNPAGRNLRNVWQFPTQGRSDAHFATFPDELPRRCILASTSAHGVCAECGAPCARTVAKVSGYEGARRHDDAQRYGLSAGSGWKNGSALAKAGAGTQTIGWQPTCQCNAEREPAIVMDPFVGSGTSCAVAQSLGRRSIGLDLNKDYLLNIAAKRITKG